jgi:hypothetical protein
MHLKIQHLGYLYKSKKKRTKTTTIEFFISSFCYKYMHYVDLLHTVSKVCNIDSYPHYKKQFKEQALNYLLTIQNPNYLRHTKNLQQKGVDQNWQLMKYG